jgi:glutamate dehydrogenase
VERRRAPIERIDQLIAELKALDHVDLSMLAVANRRLRSLMAG